MLEIASLHSFVLKKQFVHHLFSSEGQFISDSGCKGEPLQLYQQKQQFAQVTWPPVV